MKKIVAIGGAVIKTAKPLLIKAIKANQIEMLIHNGGSIFHDFQDHSYPLESLVWQSYECNREASKQVWNYIINNVAPENSTVSLCKKMNIPVLMFTGLGCDFWQLFNYNWSLIASFSYKSFMTLIKRFHSSEFHYVCMGSAVIHPEVFIKVLAISKPKKFKADAVDFKDAYRPRTRVAKYGQYFMMTHKEYLSKYIYV